MHRQGGARLDCFVASLLAMTVNAHMSNHHALIPHQPIEQARRDDQLRQRRASRGDVGEGSADARVLRAATAQPARHRHLILAGIGKDDLRDEVAPNPLDPVDAIGAVPCRS